MSQTSMILTALMTMAMLVFFAPNIFALNRGHILRNIALWLAIFLGLALIYQNFGPDGKYPLFNTPNAMMGMRPLPEDKSNAAAPGETKSDEAKPGDEEPGDDKADKPAKDGKDNKDDKAGAAQDSGEQGYTPPSE